MNGYSGFVEVDPTGRYGRVLLSSSLLFSPVCACVSSLNWEFDFGVSFCSCSTMKSLAKELQRQCMNPSSCLSLIYWNPI
jgi:hypothetical protein